MKNQVVSPEVSVRPVGPTARVGRYTQEDLRAVWDFVRIAAGVSDRNGNQPLFKALLRLANTINKDNPRYSPYEVPE